jgi:hypothetical protein
MSAVASAAAMVVGSSSGVPGLSEFVKGFERWVEIIYCSVGPENRRKNDQKGLAFRIEWSGTITGPWAISASESCPAGLMACAGLRW